MKRFCQQSLVFGILLLAFACDRPQPVEPIVKRTSETRLNYHALIIGIGDYNRTGWQTLGTARSDAEVISDILRTDYGFSVTTLIDGEATRAHTLRALDGLMSLGENDAALVFFAGHGFYDDNMDEGYWIPHGAKRFNGNLPAKEEWIWNSSVDRILAASPARHILLVVDTCYGGSLFRGETAPEKSLHWYQRAQQVPSRGLISSGNLEPVLDSGVRHSVFAQQLIHYLRHSEQDVFSASDLAVSIRSEVSRLTGQLVRMGPLNSPAHAGGEFVFVRGGVEMPTANLLNSQPTVFRNQKSLHSLKQLADRMDESGFIRPRVLACLGPDGDDPQVVRIRHQLHQSLSALGGSILVERDAFDEILQEVNLGQSKMADHRATMQIGKILPASLILFGQLVATDEYEEIHLRVVDTETSRVLLSTMEPLRSKQEIEFACDVLAQRIMSAIHQARPILLPATQQDAKTLVARWGRFHGARRGDRFQMIDREQTNTVFPKETILGSARLHSLGEEDSTFEVSWNSTNRPPNLWLKATL